MVTCYAKPKSSHPEVFCKESILKMWPNTPVFEFFFNKVDSNRGSSCEYGESFKNIYFEVHLWTAAFENMQADEREVKARFSVSVIAEYGKNNIAKNKAKIAR